MFPSNPNINDSHTEQGKGFIFNGEGWVLQSDLILPDGSMWENSGLTQIIPKSGKHISASIIDDLPEGGLIDVIKVNGDIQTITNKAVNITVPTQPSDIGAATAAQGALADTALQSFTELDPVFAASPASDITTQQVTDLHAPMSDNQVSSDFDIKDLTDSTNKRAEWDAKSTAPNDAEKNIIVGVQKNGVDLTVDVNRKVNVLVPTTAGDIGAAPALTTNQNYVSDAELAVVQDTSGVNTGNETQETIGDLIEVTELETVIDTTKFAVSDSAFLKWVSGLAIKTWLNLTYQLKLTFSTDIEADKASTTKVSAIKTFYDWAVGLFAPKANPTFSGVVNVPTLQQTVDLYFYQCASLTTDTVNDRREYTSGSVKRFQRCTAVLAGAANTKGSGTWQTDLSIFGLLLQCYNYISTGGGFSLYNNGLEMFNNFSLLWSSTGAYGGAKDTGLDKLAAGWLKIYDGVTALAYRSLALLNISKTGYDYFAVSATADTINDTRTSNQSGVRKFERCKVNSATKGDTTIGNWVTDIEIDATGKILYSGTARKKWNKYIAASITFTTGSTADNISTLQTGMDGTYMTISEASGVPGIDAYIEFTSVTAFERCRVLAAYVGTTSHQIMIQIYDWVGAAWKTFNTLESSAFKTTDLQFKNNEFTVFDDTNYIGTAGNAGKVRVRLYHPVTGNATHRLYVDEISLRQ